nr:unnamed protein product [Callosobruchus chinensis]
MHALIEKESEKRKRRKQRFWTSHFLRTRRSTQLLADLQTADSSGLFKNFCRMSQADFDLLISLIGPRISKQDTKLQRVNSRRNEIGNHTSLFGYRRFP